MKTWRYTLTTKDAERPWIVVGIEHLAVELDDGVSFHDWQRENPAGEHRSIELDPGQEPRWL